MKYMAVLVVGLIVGAAIGGSLGFEWGQGKYEFGYNQGRLTGQYDVIEFLADHFGSSAAAEKAKDTFTFKAITVSVVTENGTKTIEIRE